LALEASQLHGVTALRLRQRVLQGAFLLAGRDRDDGSKTVGVGFEFGLFTVILKS
jgi:hypothetical protein